jgi:hypothetical protein
MIEQCHGGCRAMQLISGMQTDPLMQGPISSEDIPIKIEEIELCASAQPKLDCEIWQEPFGLALVGKGHFMPVTIESKPLLDVLEDGSITMKKIEEHFGEQALKLLVLLLKKGLVRFI